MEQASPREEPKLGDRLAIERTVMAAERTLLAWVRSGVSLISFGFTIYKVVGCPCAGTGSDLPTHMVPVSGAVQTLAVLPVGHTNQGDDES